jgi:hypothetical protein
MINQYKKAFSILNKITLALLIILSLALFFHPIKAFNQDLGRHLKLGEIIISTKSVPKANLFSYTHPDFPFINHHWLSEVIFFIFSQTLGLNSIIFLKTILFSLSFFLLFFFIKKKQGTLTPTITALPFLLLFASRTEIRPEIFSYLFLSIYLILLFDQKLFKKYYYFLPLIQLLWVNTHIYFFLGPAIFTFYLFNKLARRQFQKNDFITYTLIITANLFNPNFFKGALYPFFVFKNYGYSVIENKSFFFLSNYFDRIYHPLFLCVFIVSLIVFIATIKQSSLFKILLFLFSSFLGFYALRNIAIYALTNYLILNDNLSPFKNKIVKSIKIEQKVNFIMLLYFILIPVTSFLIIKAIFENDFKIGISFGSIKAVDFLENNQIQGPVFNNFDIGSYLIYRLYPQQRVFIDGRPEAYPADFIQNTYIKMQEKKYIFDQINNHYQFNYIFFSHTDITPWAQHFLKWISKHPNWQLVYLDHFSLIFLKKSAENQPLIDKYSINLDNFSYDCQNDQKCLIQLSRALQTLKQNQN